MSGHTYIHTHIHTHKHTYTHENTITLCAHAHRGLIIISQDNAQNAGVTVGLRENSRKLRLCGGNGRFFSVRLPLRSI